MRVSETIKPITLLPTRPMIALQEKALPVADGEIILIEDDEPLAREIVEHLADLSLPVRHLSDGIAGLKKVLSSNCRLVLLDIRLPGKSGFEICRAIREVKPALPVIFLTSRGDEVDRVTGLQIGGDDYIVKPFSAAELVARVRAKLRFVEAVEKSFSEQQSPSSVSLEQRGIIVDPTTRRVTKNGEAVQLTTKEFDLLYFLMAHPGTVFTKGELLREIWDVEHQGYENSVVSMIRRVRRKLETTGESDLFRTVHGVGYAFEANVITAVDEE